MGGRGALLLGPPRAAPPVPSHWGPGGTRGEGCVPAEKQLPRGPARGPRPAPAVAPPALGLVGWFCPRPPGALLPQQPHLSRHLHAVSTSVSGEKGWGVRPPPHHKETPEERKRQGDRAVDVGASDKDASYVVREMRTKTTTSHPHRPSGPRPESATPTSPAAGEDAGPREPPCTAAGCRRCPARDAVWGRGIQRALAEGPGGRAPRRLFAQRLNAGVRRRLQQLFS